MKSQKIENQVVMFLAPTLLRQSGDNMDIIKDFVPTLTVAIPLVAGWVAGLLLLLKS